MAKRKKAKKSRSSRRRFSGMAGLGAIDFTNILGVAAGAVGGKFVNKVIPETIDKNIVAGGKIALGVALPMLVKGGQMKNIVSGIGAGMVAIGSVELLTNLGVLNGLGLIENKTPKFDIFANSLGENVLGENVLGAADDLSVINGIDDLSVINGL